MDCCTTKRQLNVFTLLYGAVSISEHIALNVNCVVNNEKERIWKEAVMDWKSLKGIEENMKSSVTTAADELTHIYTRHTSIITIYMSSVKIY
jgi:hypothetical protein